ncbi:hypothetical protein [Roseomonas elaeocarpi]|uniref:DUF1674 domain-containing protein n=1 Tax=Roseomonas elaeocarpi TaxID=907779 RepID=A0ABV6JWW2_9PROT
MAQSKHDPGDAVPPGVAVEEPAPLSAEDLAVKRRLEKLGSEANSSEARGPQAEPNREGGRRA